MRSKYYVVITCHAQPQTTICIIGPSHTPLMQAGGEWQLTWTPPCAWPTVPGLCGPRCGSGLDVIWWLASVIAYACPCAQGVRLLTKPYKALQSRT